MTGLATHKHSVGDWFHLCLSDSKCLNTPSKHGYMGSIWAIYMSKSIWVKRVGPMSDPYPSKRGYMGYTGRGKPIWAKNSGPI